jgi:hypothetical protein
VKKFIAALFLAASLCQYIQGLEIHIAPLYFINEVEDRGASSNNYHHRLASALREYEGGVDLHFTVLGALVNRNAPQSLTDALAVARSAEADYLLYGFVSQKEFSIQAEIRLLDWEKRQVVVTFFTMDETGQSDRMFKDLARKIREYTAEHYDIPLVEEPDQYMNFSLPVSLGYWTPIGKWFPLLTGTFTLNFGLSLVPRDHLFVMRGYVCYLSTGLLVNYRLGLGKEYDAHDHGLAFIVPLLMNQKLNAENEIFYGIGLGYYFDFLNIAEPYSSREVQRYNAVGFMLQGGYRYYWKENLALTIGNRLEMRGYKTRFISISFDFGINWKFYSREVVKKW